MRHDEPRPVRRGPPASIPYLAGRALRQEFMHLHGEVAELWASIPYLAGRALRLPVVQQVLVDT